MEISLQTIAAARNRIADGIYATPCPHSIALSELCSSEIYCKLEYLQRTGSFKERGARNALLLLDEKQRRHGVVAASAGNHALGLAYHGRLLGIPVTVVMPAFAPLIKRFTCENLGARVILAGDDLDAARTKADAVAREEGLSYIHGFDNPDIIAGQGTCALEVLEQVPDADALVIPVGGGGLIAGMAVAARALKPKIHIIGVEPANAASFSYAIKAGTTQKIHLEPTIADGLAVSRLGENAFSLTRHLVDEIVTVSEKSIELAMLRVFEMEKGVVEGAGATPLAALLEHGSRFGQKTVLVFSGGNIDPMVFGRVIEKAMVTDHRLCRFTAVVTDRPGGLSKLSNAIASVGAQIKDIFHDRIFSGPDVTSVNVLCVVEIQNAAHKVRLYEAIRQTGIQVIDQS
jgi:threonine dehydratase